jgi:hypothetical protein
VLPRQFGTSAVAQHDRAAQAIRREGDVVNGRPSPWIVVQEKAVRAMTALFHHTLAAGGR